ncbi:hypothetical protein [Ferrimonas sp. SCSIO 43195]|uniref:hypothetical protein n=1 Tax=Ferrimonas sp. SCSIO 43195 TaxID=2822844 RepID=UPI002075AF5D|nr:hypothetical protein [Ferrimonas sp. SCSIO 43195]USD36808.1 hypothetical protein J8Z22_17660 [Ferrimonas sp. SCSIO 43195]
MKKIISRFLVNFGAAIFYLWLTIKVCGLAISYLEVDLPDLCVYEEINKVISPNGKLIAKYGSSDCGAFSSTESGVLIENIETGEVYRGLLGIRDTPNEFRIEWESNKRLVFHNVPIDKLIWFNQKYESGVSLVIEND